MSIVASILGLALTCAIAFALTFGTARYGLTGTVVGMAGLVPLLGLQRIASRHGRSKQLFGGFAGTLGLLALSALALAAAVAVGLPNLGRLDVAVLGAGVLSALWLHAVGLGGFLWGGLAVVGIAAGGVGFVAALFQAGPNDLQAAAEAWWRAGWGFLAAAGLACAVVAVVVHWASRRLSAGGDLPVTRARYAWPRG